MMLYISNNNRKSQIKTLTFSCKRFES